jgi:hypothetical protein
MDDGAAAEQIGESDRVVTCGSVGHANDLGYDLAYHRCWVRDCVRLSLLHYSARRATSRHSICDGNVRLVRCGPTRIVSLSHSQEMTRSPTQITPTTAASNELMTRPRAEGRPTGSLSRLFITKITSHYGCTVTVAVRHVRVIDKPAFPFVGMAKNIENKRADLHGVLAQSSKQSSTPRFAETTKSQQEVFSSHIAMI